MIAWAIIQTRIGQGPGRVSFAGSNLIQGLDTARIAGIVVGTGDDAVRLVWQDGRFVVSNRDNYPAMTKEINNLILSCLDIRTNELVTNNAANHEDLEVTEEKAQSVAEFLDRDGRIITGVVVGKTEPQTGGKYVRRIDSNDVYTAMDVPWLQSSVMNYIDKEIVDIKRDEVAKVMVTGPEGSYTLKLEDSNSSTIVLENIPAGKKLKKSESDQVFSALSYLSFDDVKKESSKEEKLKFDNIYVCELKNATVYTFKIADANGKMYVKCGAKYVGETRIAVKKGESKEELKKKEAMWAAHDEAQKFTKKHQGWLYEISDWKAKNLTKKLTDLLEEEKVEEEKEKVDNQLSTTKSTEEESEIKAQDVNAPPD
jgi:hypothetical protein